MYVSSGDVFTAWYSER